MKRFIIKSTLLFVLFIISIIVFILIPLPHNTYDLAVIDKNELLKKTMGQKLVRVGGSNLAFGIDSEKIQKELNVPIINMGLQAGFGLGRILDDISLYLNSGDIIVIIPEYSHFSTAWNGSNAAFNLIFDTGFITNRQYRLILSNYYSFPKEFSSYLRNKFFSIISRIRKPAPRIYTRDGFNIYGDYIKHLNMDPIAIVPTEQIIQIDKHYLNKFNSIIEYFSIRDITILLSYPSYEVESFDNSKNFIHTLDNIFLENEKITVISKPENYRLPTNDFYDTPYHLNITGREIRTDRLITDLVTWRNTVK